MIVTGYTHYLIECRKQRRILFDAGYEEVGENGGMLWQLHRGCRQNQRIIDAVIAPEGKSVFVKIVGPKGDAP